MSFYLHDRGCILVSGWLQIKEKLVRNVFAAATHQFLFLSNKWKLRRETSNLYFQPQQISNKRMGWDRKGKYNIHVNLQVNIQAEGKKWLPRFKIESVNNKENINICPCKITILFDLTFDSWKIQILSLRILNCWPFFAERV